MDFRSDPGLPSKGERATLLLLALAALLLRGGERILPLVASGRPVLGRGSMMALAEAMDGAWPAWPALHTVPPHATLVLVGDFLMPPETLSPLLQDLASRPVRGHLVQILDAAEMDLPYQGRVRFSRPGQAETLIIPRVEAIQTRYGAALAAHNQAVAVACEQANFTYALHRTDNPPETALLSLATAMLPRGKGRQ